MSKPSSKHSKKKRNKKYKPPADREVIGPSSEGPRPKTGTMGSLVGGFRYVLGAGSNKKKKNSTIDRILTVVLVLAVIGVLIYRCR